MSRFALRFFICLFSDVIELYFGFIRNFADEVKVEYSGAVAWRKNNFANAALTWPKSAKRREDFNGYFKITLCVC